jgi:catechol 2,3-dioxygenase-like lactoylglutathione lyase family enzyme
MALLHHVALGTPDVEALARFYRELLGLAEVQRHQDEQGALRSIWLDLGGALLMIERTVAEPRHVEGVGSGPFLLAFRVTPEARSQLERQLTERGHAIESRTAFSSYSRDPDGNRFALSHYPEPPHPGP